MSETTEAYYDTELNITWLSNANYPSTIMDWATGNGCAASLNPYGSGITRWRLPNTSPVNGSAYNYSFSYIGMTDSGYNISAPGTTYAGSAGSEMAHLFFNTFGNMGYCDPFTSTVNTCNAQSNSGLASTGPFFNVQSDTYWSATDYTPDTTLAWEFNFGIGEQFENGKDAITFVWAVHPGDVGTAIVPLPAAVWLFGTA